MSKSKNKKNEKTKMKTLSLSDCGVTAEDLSEVSKQDMSNDLVKTFKKDSRARQRLMKKICLDAAKKGKFRIELETYFQKRFKALHFGICGKCLSVVDVGNRIKVYNVPKRIHSLLALPKYGMFKQYEVEYCPECCSVVTTQIE
jgi:hypothetical protein